MYLRPILYDPPHFVHVVLIDPLRVCEILSDVYGYHDLIDGAIGIG